jgi:hypothetical protein
MQLNTGDRTGSAILHVYRKRNSIRYCIVDKPVFKIKCKDSLSHSSTAIIKTAEPVPKADTF